MRPGYGITRLRRELQAIETERRNAESALEAALARAAHERALRQIAQDARTAALRVQRGETTAEGAYEALSAAWRGHMADRTIRYHWQQALEAEERLTVEKRDRELLRLYRAGYRNREIARRLGMTENYAARRLYTLRRRSLVKPSDWIPPAPAIAGPPVD